MSLLPQDFAGQGSAGNQAVFLSYASQDAGAVERIAEALRASGVEVWFDKNELVGGDAWDAKIRKQIKECALFVPVISANTNARAEGYFRLEWKLAVDRSHLMADDAPFLFPVVIDETTDAAARVPDKFREVQWTRLSVKDTPETLAKRVAKLLGGASDAGPAAGRAPDQRPGRQKKKSAWMGYFWTAFGLIIGLVYAIRPLWSPPRSHEAREPKPAAVTTAPIPANAAPASNSSASAAPLSEARQLVARARALSLDKYDSTPEDFRAAENLLKRALELDPNDAEIWAFSSLLNLSFGTRGFDHAEARPATALSHAQRALSLNADSLEGRYALARWQRDYDEPAGEASFKTILDRNPNHPGALGGLAWIYERQDRVAEAAALYERSATSPGANPALSRYTEYLLYFHRARFEDAERVLRQSIAAQVSANSQAALAVLLLTWKGDAEGAAKVLASGPTATRSEARTIWTTALVQLCQRSPDAVLRTLDRFSDDFMQDNWVTAPKAYFAGRAQAMAGHHEAARLAWEAGLGIVDARLKSAPQNHDLHLMRGELLAFLGRGEEALGEARTVDELARREDRYWFGSPVLIFAILGRADDALPVLEKQLQLTEEHANVGWPLTPALLRLDPIWDKIRDDPRFQKLCAEPAAEKNSGATGASVALPASEAAQLAARARALYEKVGFTRDDLAPAEDFARRATEKEPDNAAAWGVRAGVQAAWQLRGWDTSEKRRQDAQTFANRALALDPEEPEALIALGVVLRTQGASDQAVAHLRRAYAAHPEHVRLARTLGYTLNQAARDGEARVVLQAAATLHPHDPLLLYDLALTYGAFGGGGANPENLANGLERLDTAIAIQPFSSALILKAALIGGWRGDWPGMRATLDQVDKLPFAARAEDRTVCIAMWAGLMERHPERVEAAAALTARNYFDDVVMPCRPKSWALALAHRLAGKDNLARADWHAAETVLRQRGQSDPANLDYQVELAITLAWLEQREEAARLIAAVEPLWKEAPTIASPRMLALYYAALGDAAKALPYLTATVDRSVFTSRKAIPVDPFWDKLHGGAEFEAFLKKLDAKP